MSLATDFIQFLEKQDPEASGFILDRMSGIDPGIIQAIEAAKMNPEKLPVLEQKIGNLASADQFTRALLGGANIQSANISTSGDVKGDQTIVGNVVAGGNVNIKFPDPPIPPESLEKARKIATEYADVKLPPLIKYSGISALPVLGFGLVIAMILLAKDAIPEHWIGWAVMGFGAGALGLAFIGVYDRGDWRMCLKILEIEGERAGYDKIIEKLKKNFLAKFL